MSTNPGCYDPRSFKASSFHEACARFRDGSDSPSAYLERCLEVIAERDDVVRAYVSLNEAQARDAARASTARWRAGEPRSAIDGMPVSIKDLLETRDMPTEMGCEAMRGNFPKRDNAAVWALREAGAVVLGKTVTAEIGGAHPGPTTNPFNPARTPGGSSSGSAAAVAAGMVPAAIGTQVGGSIIRPAGFCGNFALKPTQGGINRGERQATSMSTHGVHAGTLADMWQVAIEIAQRAGGDRGARALQGPGAPPRAVRPERLMVLETSGWAGLDSASQRAFEGALSALEASGVAVIRRGDDPLLDALERSVANAGDICNAITGWENRWNTRALVDRDPEGVSERAKGTLARAEAMSVRDYEFALLQRALAQASHAALAARADALVSLACPGPAPLWSGDVPGAPLAARPTGDAVFNYPSSMLFAPAVTVPLLAVAGMPVGVALIGQQHEDARVTGCARWLHETIAPIVEGEA